MNEVGGARGTLQKEQKCVLIFDGKSEGKRLLGRPTRGWVDNNKMDIK
jgi:hypothetical protein